MLDRKKRRLPCVLRLGSQQFTGMVLDVSASGVFVQTSAKVSPGDALEMELSVPGSAELVEVAREEALKQLGEGRQILEVVPADS